MGGRFSRHPRAPCFEETYTKFKLLAKAVEEFRTCIENNGDFIVDYDER